MDADAPVREDAKKAAAQERRNRKLGGKGFFPAGGRLSRGDSGAPLGGELACDKAEYRLESAN